MMEWEEEVHEHDLDCEHLDEDWEHHEHHDWEATDLEETEGEQKPQRGGRRG